MDLPAHVIVKQFSLLTFVVDIVCDCHRYHTRPFQLAFEVHELLSVILPHYYLISGIEIITQAYTYEQATNYSVTPGFIKMERMG